MTTILVKLLLHYRERMLFFLRGLRWPGRPSQALHTIFPPAHSTKPSGHHSRRILPVRSSSASNIMTFVLIMPPVNPTPSRIHNQTGIVAHFRREALVHNGGKRRAANFSFPSAAPSETTRWPSSRTARVSQAKRPSELIPCIRRQTRGRALTVRDPQM